MANTPAASPFITPALLIVASMVLLLAHDPPVVVLLSVVVAPTHTSILPVMGAGIAFTVITAVVVELPQPLEVV